MKSGLFFTIFIGTHIVFIFLQIHKNALYIKQSFRQQKNELLIVNLQQHKQTLTNSLYALQNKMEIKHFAQDNLKMRPVTLSQVKRIGMSHDTHQ